MNKRFAFTLAEIMVSVGIIGVIAALTVPTLVDDYQKKTQAVQFRKVVNDIATAVDLHMTEEGKNSFDATSAYKDLSKLFEDANKKQLKIIKTCAANSTGCFASEKYLSISGTAATELFKCTNKSYVLANSAAVCMTGGQTTNGTDVTKADVTVVVDINGKESPNIAGRDLFMFSLDSKTGEPTASGASGDCTTNTTGTGCYALLVEDNNWQMTY